MSEEVQSVVEAIEGSSAGFLAVVLEGIEEGAVEAGLPRETVRALVRQTALGTALLVESHPGSPADLKDQVASPGGTTIAGLAVLEDRGVRGALIRAVETAAGRRRASGDVRRAAVGGGRQQTKSNSPGQTTPSEGRAK